MFSVVFSSPQSPTEECTRWRVLRSPGTMESLVGPFTNARCYKGVSWDCVQSFQAGRSRALMMCRQPLCLLLALPPQRPPQCFPRRRAEVVRPGGGKYVARVINHVTTSPPATPCLSGPMASSGSRFASSAKICSLSNALRE